MRGAILVSIISVVVWVCQAHPVEQIRFSRALATQFHLYKRDHPLQAKILELISDLVMGPPTRRRGGVEEPGVEIEKRIGRSRTGRFLFPDEHHAKKIEEEQERSASQLNNYKIVRNQVEVQEGVPFLLRGKNRVFLEEPNKKGKILEEDVEEPGQSVWMGISPTQSQYNSGIMTFRKPISVKVEKVEIPLQEKKRSGKSLGYDFSGSDSEWQLLGTSESGEAQHPPHFSSISEVGVGEMKELPRVSKVMRPSTIRSQPLIVKDARDGRSLKQIEVQGVKIIVGARTPEFPKDVFIRNGANYARSLSKESLISPSSITTL
jgi:hypothetical protein